VTVYQTEPPEALHSRQSGRRLDWPATPPEDSRTGCGRRIRLDEGTGGGGEGTWRIEDPVGGPATLRILPPEQETLKSVVRGSVRYETD